LSSYYHSLPEQLSHLHSSIPLSLPYFQLFLAFHLYFYPSLTIFVLLSFPCFV
jgi:hypothetical protein